MTWARMTQPPQPPGTTPGGLPRGRPRSLSARLAILEAAAELLLEHGMNAVSMDSVAERAGVSKATIYRWWPSKEVLSLEAVLERWNDSSLAPGGPDTGSLRADLYGRVRPWASVLRPPFARVIAAFVAHARSNAAFGALYTERLLMPRRDAARPIFLRAIARGDIPADTDVECALDMLYGPIYHRLLHGHAPIDERFIRGVVETVADALESRVRP
ncbi:MAG: hypothetical protein QOK22_693 [Gaiellaceae bacterium]|nr:hypothetical protein [Gaiellaceae bacterium]